MIKKITVPIFMASLLLGACTTPEYNSGKVDDAAPVYELEQDPIALGSIEGVVVEVTEDNTVKIRLPRGEEDVPEGMNLNVDGLLEVGFSTLEIPEHETYQKALESYLLNKEVQVLLEEKTASEILGQVFVKSVVDEKELLTGVQEYLYHDGLIEFYSEVSHFGQKVKETEAECKAQAKEDEDEENYKINIIAGAIKCGNSELTK